MGGKPIHRPKRSETLTLSSASSAAAIRPVASSWPRGIRWRRLEVATNSTLSGGPETPPSSADFSALAAAAPSSNDRSSQSTTNRSGRPRRMVEQGGQGGDLASRSTSTSFRPGAPACGLGHEGGLGQRALAGAARRPTAGRGWTAGRGEAAQVLDEPRLLAVDADQQVERQAVVGGGQEARRSPASWRNSRAAAKSGAAGGGRRQALQGLGDAGSGRGGGRRCTCGSMQAAAYRVRPALEAVPLQNGAAAHSFRRLRDAAAPERVAAPSSSESSHVRDPGLSPRPPPAPPAPARPSLQFAAAARRADRAVLLPDDPRRSRSG